MNKILILFAHPALEKSRVNKYLASVAREVPDVTFHDLYSAYPDFIIDVKFEQNLLNRHDVIIFQHPFYWYNTPAILKEWADLVLEYGYAYGEGGNKLRGKAWLNAFSTGGPQSAYSKDGYNRYTIKELLAPLDQTAHLCGMHFLNPFVVHNSLDMDHSKELPIIGKKYQKLILDLQDSQRPWTEYA